MRLVRWQEVGRAGRVEGTGVDLPYRPRLGVQFDPDADGRGGKILPLDVLPGLGDDPHRARALADADLAMLLGADPDLASTRASLERLGDPASSVHLLPGSSVRLLAPVHRPSKIVCIGHNYREHVEEQGLPVPERPTLFAKWANAVIGDGEPVIRPDVTDALDLEAELGVVIGITARRVPAGLALSHVGACTVVNDVSARDLQGSKPALKPGGRGDGQWVRAKGSDTFLPMGPAIVTPDELTDAQSRTIRSWRTSGDGAPFLMQQGNTGSMIFDVAHLIEFISAVITLEPGDVIATGTPSGVGVFRTPPVFLEPGDVASVAIEGIGRLDNPIAAADGTVPRGSAAAAMLGDRG